jgi:hypothetical protein
MDETFTINLFLADKYYPLKIKRSEEELVRKAGKMVNDKLAQYQNRFNTDEAGLDLKDLIAMVACQIAIESLKAVSKGDSELYSKRIAQLNIELEDFLK